MKAKMVGLMVLVLHVLVIAGFSLMQGCTTGTCPIPWLNWPYSSRQPEPVIFPADDLMALPPVSVTGTPGLSSVPYSGGSEQTYSVRKGDTLSAIASMYGTTWKKLAEYNNLSNPNRLLAGQEIRIPAGLSAPSAPVRRTTSPAPHSRPSAPVGQGSSYVIQKGDTLGAIAKRSGLTVAELKAANGLSSDRIIAGKSLTIPRKGTVKAAPSAAAKPAAPKPAVKPAVQAEPAPAPVAELSPAPVAESVPSAAPLASSASAPVYDHVLYPGETLDDVARQYATSKTEIMKLNNITDPDSVKPGTKLLVPIGE